MIDYHLGCFNAQRVLLQPLEEVAIRSAANIEEQIFDVVQLVIVTRLVVYVVAQILQIFHSGAAGLT